ncbi:MAG: ATP-dependent Clp protease ATP-binding subunit, partial [Chloroflexi bacterium]|nr:ATP-dependent Clp protease ATP-binding subunit [Chloroflexota bacterium]
EVKRFFRQEFLNRIDASVVFHQLTKDEILQIVNLMMDQVRKELAEKEIELELTEAARVWLGEKGFDPVLGARPLRRLIQNEVEDRLSDEVLGGRLNQGDVAVVDLEEDSIVIKPRKGTSSKEQEPEPEAEQEPEPEPEPEPASA